MTKRYSRPKIFHFEYASFRNDIVKRFISNVLPSSKVVLDPMAGTAPLLPYCEQFSLIGLFNDILPQHFYINRAKTFKVFKSVSKVLSKKKSYFYPELYRTFRSFNKFKLVFSDTWIKDEILDQFIDIWNITNNYDENLRTFFRAIIILTVRYFSGFSTSRNATWLKEGGMTSDIDIRDILDDIVDRFLSYYNFYYLQQALSSGGDIEFYTQSAEDLSIEHDVDTIITSPPFPNRYDILRAYAPELYFLSKVVKGCSVEELKEQIIGTNVVKGYNVQKNALHRLKKVARKTWDFILEIEEIEKHKSKRKENFYYHRYFVRFYTSLYDVLDHLIDTLCINGSIYVVVQNNIHRGLLNDMNSFIVDYFIRKGLSVDEEYSQPRPHQGRRNISEEYPLVLKKQRETIIKATK